MKKLSVLLIVLSLIISSCTTESVDMSNNSEGIVGTWIGVSVDYSGTTVTTAQGQTISADYVGEAYDVDYSLTFSENPNNLISEGAYSIKLTTSVAGQTTTQNVENLEVLGNGTWEISENNLSITSNGKTSSGTIVELTESTLILTNEEVVDLSQQGISVISTTNVVTTYRK